MFMSHRVLNDVPSPGKINVRLLGSSTLTCIVRSASVDRRSQFASFEGELKLGSMGVSQSHCEENPEAAKGQQDIQNSDTVRPRDVPAHVEGHCL